MQSLIILPFNVFLTFPHVLQWVRCGDLHHQLPRGLSVRRRELQSKHHRGGEPQTAAENPSGETENMISLPFHKVTTYKVGSNKEILYVLIHTDENKMKTFLTCVQLRCFEFSYSNKTVKTFIFAPE